MTDDNVISYGTRPKGTGQLILHNTPQRTWVGLTSQEQDEIWLGKKVMSLDDVAFADAIEAKLKEKNT